MIIVQEIQAKVFISMLIFSRSQASKKRLALGMRKAGLRSWLPVEGGQGDSPAGLSLGNAPPRACLGSRPLYPWLRVPWLCPSLKPMSRGNMEVST